jgi:hypothetical protein
VPLSFTTDIRQLFRQRDVDVMKEYTLDLSSYADVKAQASEIYERLENGTMPCDEPWPEERVRLFKQWMEDGMLP